MRGLNLLAAFVGTSTFASAQLIDLDYVNALPDPTYTIIPDKPSQVVAYNEAAAISSAVAQVAETPVPEAKRDLPRDLNKRRDCDPATTRENTYNAVLNPASAFKEDSALTGAAQSAPVPRGYRQTFSNKQASSQANGYMGYALPPSYDTEWCANRCNITNGCQAFNIYFERSPSVSPGDSCPDPDAFANIVCTFWGGPVLEENARNEGQWRNRFNVVITGSNGYVLTATPTIYGYAPPSPLASRAINAPRDCNNQDTYLGMRLFNDNSPFDPDRCAAVCRATSDYNIDQQNGRDAPKLCKFFNTYILARNGVSQGQVCAMYTQYWNPAVYATNDGQYDGDGNRFTIQSSYTFYNSTDVVTPLCPSDIASLQRDTVTAGPYCTSFNHYSAPTSTISVTSTSFVVSCQTAVPKKRGASVNIEDRDADGSAELVEAVVAVYPHKDSGSGGTPALVTIPAESLAIPGIYASATSAAAATATVAGRSLRRRALAAPSILQGRQPLEVASACSRVATGTATTTSTSTATRSACGQLPSTCSNGDTIQLIAGDFTRSTVNIDDAAFTLTLPFEICIYGECSTTVHPTSNGIITLGNNADASYGNTPIPRSSRGYLYAYWDDLYIYSGYQHYISSTICGRTGSRTVTFNWRVAHITDTASVFIFSATFYENQPAKISLKYDSTSHRGSSATVGIEGVVDSRVLSYQHEYNQQASIPDGLELLFDYHANFFGRKP